MTFADIARCLVEQNLPTASQDEFTSIYMYPEGEKKCRSWIFETKPEHRAALIKTKRLYINWLVCRVEDHVSILQCYKCCGFGHVAKDCDKKICCSYCAGEHRSDTCKSRKNLKCVNCCAAQLPNISHAASNRAVCPILCKKIERKITSVNYGY